ncbi:hypothetical protein [Sphingobacterium alkalisoli]|nr:hypothetical protein [Sphingobacterium alkalisoli]
MGQNQLWITLVDFMELLVQLLRPATNGLARTGNIIIVHGEGINIREAVREHIGLLGCINGQVEELLWEATREVM